MSQEVRVLAGQAGGPELGSIREEESLGDEAICLFSMSVLLLECISDGTEA